MPTLQPCMTKDKMSQALAHTLALLTACGDKPEQIRSVLAKHRADSAPGKFISVIEPLPEKPAKAALCTLASNVMKARKTAWRHCSTLHSADDSQRDEGKYDGADGATTEKIEAWMPRSRLWSCTICGDTLDALEAGSPCNIEMRPFRAGAKRRHSDSGVSQQRADVHESAEILHSSSTRNHGEVLLPSTKVLPRGKNGDVPGKVAGKPVDETKKMRRGSNDDTDARHPDSSIKEATPRGVLSSGVRK